MKFLKLGFLANPELGLLILRGWLGLTMLINHGIPSKLMKFNELAGTFADPLGIGSRASLSLAIFSEVICSILLVIGLFTRLAALSLAITMSVAFLTVHQASLTGSTSGELAFIYLAGFLSLVFCGGGQYSVDGED